MTRFTFLIILMISACVSKNHTGFKSERISRSASFTIDGPIEKVFPLFGPIREMEWAEGWNLEIIFSESPEVEEHMIFQTSGGHGGEKYTWVITQFNPELHQIEYTVSTSERIWFIRVQCESMNAQTKATVTYTYTGLSSSGNEKNKEALAKMFSKDLADWQEAINHYLQTGELLTTKH